MDEQYIYQADTWCRECGEAIRARLTFSEHRPEHPEDEETYDSDKYPKGPYLIREDEDGPFYCGSGTDCPNYDPGDDSDTTLLTELASDWGVDDVFEAYVECALWSTYDNANEQGGEPFDENYDASSLAPSTLAIMRDDCKAFLDAHYGALKEADRDSDLGQFGHDFWLTREGHGAGFWDGDWPEPLAKLLTDAAHVYGSFEIYVGDDGKIYAMGYETYTSPEKVNG